MSGDGPEWDEFKRTFKQARAEENSRWERTERDRAEGDSRWERNERDRAEENSRWERTERDRREENSQWERNERDRAEENSRWERTERDRREENFQWEGNERDRAEENSRWERAERLAKSIADTLRPVARGEVSTALGDALTQKRVEVFSARSGFERSNWNQTLSKAAGMEAPKPRVFRGYDRGR